MTVRLLLIVGIVLVSQLEELDIYRFANTFPEIVQSDTFIDKSELIPMVVTSCLPVVFTAPKLFGKSVNLDMIRCFFELQYDKVTGKKFPTEMEESNRKLFDGLKIMEPQYTNLVGKYFGKFPVLKFNLFYPEKMNRILDMVVFFLTVIRSTFEEHPFLQTSPRLSKKNRYRAKGWCPDGGMGKYDVKEGFELMCKFMHDHFNIKVVVLIDDYDSILLQAMEDYGELSFTVKSVYMEIMEALLLNEHVQLIVLTGITDITDFVTHNFSFTINKFLHTEHFGFTSAEANKLFERFNLTEEQKLIAEETYGGYHLFDARCALYNPYSVIKYVTSDMNQALSYWCNADFVWSLSNIFKNGEEKKKFLYEYLIHYRSRDLSNLAVGVHLDSEVISRILLSHGFLSYNESCQRLFRCKIPNEELWKEYAKHLIHACVKEYNIKYIKLHDAICSYRRLHSSAAQEFVAPLQDFKRKLQDLISDATVNLTNMRMKEILFIICKSGLKPLGEVFPLFQEIDTYRCTKQNYECFLTFGHFNYEALKTLYHEISFSSAVEYYAIGVIFNINRRDISLIAIHKENTGS